MTKPHNHSHTDDDRHSRNKLVAASLLCVVFAAIEAVGGYKSGSLAILSDASHLLADLGSFLISLGSIWVAAQPPTKRMSFGFHRAEILGALLSILLIWVLTGTLIYSAIHRFYNPTPIDAKIMVFIATIGLVFNIAMALTLGHSHGHHHHDHDHDHHDHHDHSSQDAAGLARHHGHDHEISLEPLAEDAHSRDSERTLLLSPQRHVDGGSPSYRNYSSPANSGDLAASTATAQPPSPPKKGFWASFGKSKNININAALIHVLGDLIQNIGVLITAVVIYYRPDYVYFDPICTLFFCVIVALTTFSMLDETLSVLMEATPAGLDPGLITLELESLQGVLCAHDLHVWQLNTQRTALAVHLLIGDELAPEVILFNAQNLLCSKYGIHHATIQMEKEHSPSHCAPYHASGAGSSSSSNPAQVSPCPVSVQFRCM